MDFFRDIDSKMEVCSDSDEACINQKFFLCLDQVSLLELDSLYYFSLL